MNHPLREQVWINRRDRQRLPSAGATGGSKTDGALALVLIASQGARADWPRVQNNSSTSTLRACDIFFSTSVDIELFPFSICEM